MKHKSIYLLIALVAIASMMVSACVATPAPAPPEEAAPAEEPAEEAAPTEEELTIALSIPGLQFPFFVFMEQQVKDEAAKIGGIEIVTLDAQRYCQGVRRHPHQPDDGRRHGAGGAAGGGRRHPGGDHRPYGV
jgi:ABC-type sugar transport system substrate-binding protein